jgi:hypothetical protein
MGQPRHRLPLRGCSRRSHGSSHYLVRGRLIAWMRIWGRVLSHSPLMISMTSRPRHPPSRSMAPGIPRRCFDGPVSDPKASGLKEGSSRERWLSPLCSRRRLVSFDQTRSWIEYYDAGPYGPQADPQKATRSRSFHSKPRAAGTNALASCQNLFAEVLKARRAILDPVASVLSIPPMGGKQCHPQCGCSSDAGNSSWHSVSWQTPELSSWCRSRSQAHRRNGLCTAESA